jgi:hypothetical protein
LSNGKLPYRVPEQLRFPAIIRQTATDTTLTSQNLPDIKNLQDALNKLIDFDKKNQDELCSYTVRYDEDKIPKESLAHQLLETYVKKLSEQLDGKDRIKLKGAKLKDNNIISVECQTRSGKVIGQASVGITEDVSGKAMRLIGMLNIAFIASQIPKGISQQEASSYDNLISLIKTQYKDICDEDLIVDLLKDTASGIHIRLPRVAPVPLDKVDEYYRLTIIQLKKAA